VPALAPAYLFGLPALADEARADSLAGACMQALHAVQRFTVDTSVPG
jgi:hypothetical protein